MSNIIIPKHREIILPTSKLGLSGEYRMVVRRGQDMSIKHDTGWFPNIITDLGLNRLGQGGSFVGCSIGTGTSTPAAGDTALASFSAYTTVSAPGSGTTTNEGSPNYVTRYAYNRRFNIGALNGTYSEVGMGWASNQLFSRALILDGSFSPTTITVLPSEQLDVYYVVRLIPNLVDQVSVVTISGTPYTITRRPLNVNSWGADMANYIFSFAGYDYGSNGRTFTGALGPVTGTPGGTAHNPFRPGGDSPYSLNSFQINGSYSWLTSDANIGGVQCVEIGGRPARYQYQFSPVLAKDVNKTMSLSGTLTWARA